jgi:hypothetical protein
VKSDLERLGLFDLTNLAVEAQDTPRIRARFRLAGAPGRATVPAAEGLTALSA